MRPEPVQIDFNKMDIYDCRGPRGYNVPSMREDGVNVYMSSMEASYQLASAYDKSLKGTAKRARKYYVSEDEI